jgi:hypothetical protein
MLGRPELRIAKEPLKTREEKMTDEYNVNDDINGELPGGLQLLLIKCKVTRTASPSRPSGQIAQRAIGSFQ